MANLTLEIIQPQPCMDTTNRFYKAYPGLEYNVRVAVVGGDYPYEFSLTTAPTGMSIDSSTGVITWSNPTTSGSPHTVTVQVTDIGAAGGGEGSGGNTDSVSWTITVTTSGFVFIDANCGNDCTGDGTKDNPFQTLEKIHNGSWANTTYQDQFLYMYGGTYTLGFTTTAEATDNCWGGTATYFLWGGNKPVVWLAYPGATPTMDLGAGGGQCLGWYGGSVDNTYIDGVTFSPITNPCRYGIAMSSGGDDITLYRCAFSTLTHTTGSNNQSMLFWLKNGIGVRKAVLNCTFDSVDHGYFILGYSSSKVLIDGNTFSNMQDSGGHGAYHSVGPKEGDQEWTIRNNTLFDSIDGNGIHILYGDVAAGGQQNSGNHEVCYNLVKTVEETTRAVDTNQGGTASVGDAVWIYRNTIINGRARSDGLETTTGPFTWTHNIVISSKCDKIDCLQACNDLSKLVEVDNLEGTTCDGIVDANGNLQGDYRTDYLGIRGYELGTATATATGPLLGLFIY